MNYSTSRQLIYNIEKFSHLKYYSKFKKYYSKDYIFYGWGRRKSGLRAIELSKKFNSKFVLLEDGFIRSLGLGVNASPSFSIVEDNIGIYYDATEPSKLENILNNYDFTSNQELIETSKKAIKYIIKHNISKYNNSKIIKSDFFKNENEKRILVISQTEGDASLKYGMIDNFTTDEIVDTAIMENPNATVYLKVHPDVLTGKKKSDLDIESVKNRCIIIEEDVNPISLLKYFSKVYTKTSQMGFEALLVGCECVCFGMPFYAGWGITIDNSTCDRRKEKRSIEEVFAAAYILYSRYYNPYRQKKSNILDTIETINKYRNINNQNKGKLFLFGFSLWKRWFTIPFLNSTDKNKKIFCSNIKEALQKGLKYNDKVFIWGKKPFNDVEDYARKHNIFLSRIEDGFIRSVSLGSDLTKAYSLVVDSRGIYFDPTQESDLEYILKTVTFDKKIIERAKKLKEYLVEKKLSKYNIYKDEVLDFQGLKKNQKMIMVPGQVEDDASIRYGANGMTNLKLLEQTRSNAPDAYIIYKPHPDVLAGNRKGNISKEDALKFCDIIIEEVSIDSVLEQVDEVHTMTSLVGFEALMRGKKVYTYGLPFYAGWGLTVDSKNILRRSRKLLLEELIAATLILYPRYIHPKTNAFCEVEVLLDEIDKEKKRYNNCLLCRLYIDSRNAISRKIQLIIKVLLSE